MVRRCWARFEEFEYTCSKIIDEHVIPLTKSWVSDLMAVRVMTSAQSPSESCGNEKAALQVPIPLDETGNSSYAHLVAVIANILLKTNWRDERKVYVATLDFPGFRSVSIALH